MRTPGFRRRLALFLVACAGGAGLWLVTARPGPLPVAAMGGPEGVDCNGNGADDATDIASGSSLDCDGDGVPDECATAPPPPLSPTLVAEGLGFITVVEPIPGVDDRLLVGMKHGRIALVDTAAAAVIGTVLELTVNASSERGLLGLAVEPSPSPDSAWLYVAYSASPSGTLRIARFALAADGTTADPASELLIKSIEHTSTTHIGGQLRFGPDGMLYYAAGDGTSYADSDPNNNAQRGDTLLGKVLRLDPSAPPDYVADDNPHLADPETCDEIWARGLRNPWRFSFDRLTGDLYLTDVGLDTREEIDVAPAGSPGGRNYGWRCLEGTRCTGFAGPCACDDPTLVPPAFEIDRDGGCWAIIGGFVYRGCRIPTLNGRYLFANYCDGGLYSLQTTRANDGTIVLDDLRDHTDELNPPHLPLITTFGEDGDGELYYATIFGTVWRIDPGLDCNANGIADHVDVEKGTSQDVDGDGVPDECAPSADVNGDGVIDVDDLLAVILAWGVCPAPPSACPADVNRDGTVDVDDLLFVLLSW